jgi:hypothetical protein
VYPPLPPFPPEPPVGDYPVQLTITDERIENRWWGIPFFGVLVRIILLIPHLLFLLILGFVAMIWLFLFGWIPILLLGRVPGFQAAMIKELLHRSIRVEGYAYLLPDYPPLGIGEPGPVDVTFQLEGLALSRWWGIPFIGFFARVIVLIPHFIVLSVLTFATTITFSLVWIPILLWGRIPDLAVRIYDATFRYSVRVSSYALLLPIAYPPFSFS